MKKTGRILLIGGILFVAGILTVGGVLLATGTEWSRLNASTEEYTPFTEHYDNITSLSVTTAAEDVILLPADDGQVTVEGYQSEHWRCEQTVRDGTLTLRMEDDREWYRQIGVWFTDRRTPERLTVRIPESVTRITVTTASGDVDAEALHPEEMTVTTASGDTELSDVTADNIRVTTASGDVGFDGITAAELTVKTTSGDVGFDGITAAELTVKTTSGEIDMEDFRVDSVRLETVSGNITAETDRPMICTTHTASGRVRVPASGGTAAFDAKTVSGDITVRTGS